MKNQTKSIILRAIVIIGIFLTLYGLAQGGLNYSQFLIGNYLVVLTVGYIFYTFAKGIKSTFYPQN